MRNVWTSKWLLQPVRRCCKGSIFTRVVPAQVINYEKSTFKRILRAL